MRHFFVYPSAKLEIGTECANAWEVKGYDILMGVDDSNPVWFSRPLRHAIPILKWEGYYRAINPLVVAAFEFGADLVTVGGDDQYPPEQGAQWVADAYFSRWPDGSGVMQAAGDPQGEIINGVHNAARICGSPTFGKGWMANAFGGAGPFGDFGFRSFYCDEMLKEVAERLGLLWMNHDITIDHAHWSFGRRPRQEYHVAAEKNWEHDKAIFDRVKVDNFKECLELFRK